MKHFFQCPDEGRPDGYTGADYVGSGSGVERGRKTLLAIQGVGRTKLSN